MNTTAPRPSEVRLVVVEDQTLFRKMLIRLLRTDPRLVVAGEAMDGETALGVCRQVRPDLVLLDLDLPRLSGVEVARALRVELPQTRVLVLSGRDDGPGLRDALRSGIAGLVDKDQAFEVLQAAIDCVLAGDTYFTGVAARELRAMPAEKEAAGAMEELTPREKEVLHLVARGLTTKEAAAKLEISARTVEVYRQSLMKKLGVRNVAELSHLATRHGIEP